MYGTSDSPNPVTELAELAGGFIHELKNHLSTLGLNLQLLAGDFEAAETQRERRARDRVQRLQSECGRLVDIANDFLRFARLKELSFEPVALATVIEDMVDFFNPTARAANITFELYLPADLPAVSLDVDQFKQVLLNLMLNAEQAMPAGGEVTIQATRDDGQVRLDLIDTGPGMPADVAAKIFKPFFSTKPGGTGLGLPISRKIVEAHGGRLEVQSEPGRGTKFSVWLPAV